MDATEAQVRQAAIERLESALAGLGPMPAELTPRALLSTLQRIGPWDHYKVLPGATMKLFETVQAAHGEPALRRFLFATLMQGTADLLQAPAFHSLPPRARRHHLVQLQRIAAIDDPEAPWLTPSSDLLHKDLGLVTLRLYAAAGLLLDPRCGLPRSVVALEGLHKAPAKLWAIAQLGGFRPFFQIHAHIAYLTEFNEEGRKECYRTCAELFALHPGCLGVFGSSWYYDPALETISPRLRYLRDMPLQGGAMFTLAARDGHFAQDAIATSPTRRALYEQGKYSPRSYMMIWGRQALLRWVEGVGR